MSGELGLPRWLKQNFRSIPACDINLIANVVPQKNPLMNLRVKLHESEIGLLNENLKYIFPFYKVLPPPPRTTSSAPWCSTSPTCRTSR
jgi:hypothetical protein